MHPAFFCVYLSVELGLNCAEDATIMTILDTLVELQQSCLNVHKCLSVFGARQLAILEGRQAVTYHFKQIHVRHAIDRTGHITRPMLELDDSDHLASV